MRETIRNLCLGILLCISVGTSGSKALAVGDTQKCLELSDEGRQLSLWQSVSTYFSTLAPVSLDDQRKTRLMELRSELVQLELQKRKLIDILDAHLIAGTTHALTASRIKASDIPKILLNIDNISDHLNSISGDSGDPFLAQQSFKDISIAVAAKESTLTCQLEEQAGGGLTDRTKVATISRQLAEELTAISNADDALGRYLRGLH